MEKLIDLLNEYEEYAFPEDHPHTIYPDGWTDDGDYRYLGHEYLLGQKEGLNFSHGSSVKNSDLNHLYVISKEFGFIKWLVDNDKIDLGKIKKLYRKSNEHSTHTYPILYDYSYDESLLMFLAIQDEPINFLIQLLN